MSKPKVMFTRPACWAGLKSDRLDLVHAPMSPGEETLLKSKKPCYESVGGVMTDRGADNLLRLFEEHKPDVFLFWCTYMQDGSANRLAKIVRTLKRCRSVSPGTKFLYGNGNQQGSPDHNVRAYMQAGVDGVLTNTRDEREARMYRRHGVPFVDTLYTFGFDPAEHGPDAFPGVKARWDCLFGGSQTVGKWGGKRTPGHYPYEAGVNDRYANSRERLELMTAVDRRFDLVVHGKGTWKVRNPRPYVHGRDYPKALRTAKILLNNYHWDLERYYTKRTVFSGASGRLLVCKYIPGMEKDFESGENVVWFKSQAKALEKIDYYLKHDEERERVAKAQREHFVRHHSWEARLRDFEEIVDRCLR